MVDSQDADDWYVLFGGSANRNWEEARTYGFVSAAGAHSEALLRRLAPGARIWVYLPKLGYAGVGTVTAPVTPLRDFTVQTEGGARRLVEIAEATGRLTTSKWEPRKTENVVAVRWLKTVPATEAVQGDGFFTNQNVACKPHSDRWAKTVAALKRAFGV